MVSVRLSRFDNHVTSWPSLRCCYLDHTHPPSPAVGTIPCRIDACRGADLLLDADSYDFRCASCQQHSTCSHASDRTPCKAKVSTLLHTRNFREARHAGLATCLSLCGDD